MLLLFSSIIAVFDVQLREEWAKGSWLRGGTLTAADKGGWMDRWREEKKKMGRRRRTSPPSPKQTASIDRYICVCVYIVVWEGGDVARICGPGQKDVCPVVHGPSFTTHHGPCERTKIKEERHDGRRRENDNVPWGQLPTGLGLIGDLHSWSFSSPSPRGGPSRRTKIKKGWSFLSFFLVVKFVSFKHDTINGMIHGWEEGERMSVWERDGRKKKN